MVLVLCACGDATSQTESEAIQQDETSSAEEASSESAADSQYAGYSVVITGCDYASNDEGNTAVICYFTFTNDTESAITPAEAVVCQAFQDGMSLSQATISNSALYDNGASLAQSVPAGETVTCMVAYTQMSDAVIEFTVSSDSCDVTTTFEAAA